MMHAESFKGKAERRKLICLISQIAHGSSDKHERGFHSVTMNSLENAAEPGA